MSMIKLITLFLFAIVLSASKMYAQKKERYGWGQYTEVGVITYQNYHILFIVFAPLPAAQTFAKVEYLYTLKEGLGSTRGKIRV